jgi:hypothetical protein
MSLAEIGATPRERWQSVASEVAAKYGIGVDDYIKRGFLKQPARSARIEFCYRMTQETEFSTPVIARIACLADHTTVYYCAKRFAALQGDPKALRWWKRKNARSRKSCIQHRGENRAVNPYAQRYNRSNLFAYMKDEFFKGGEHRIRCINYFFRYDRAEGCLVRNFIQYACKQRFYARDRISVSHGGTMAASRGLWILLTGENPAGVIVTNGKSSLLRANQIFHKGETLSEYLRRIPGGNRVHSVHDVNARGGARPPLPLLLGRNGSARPLSSDAGSRSPSR